MTADDHTAPSERTTVRRGRDRAVYAPDAIREILAAGVVAHVGVETPTGPIVLPMAYGVRDDEILLHGGVANAMLRGADSAEVCVTVTLVDGLVVARSPLHNSMNYRSVVIRGRATRLPDADKVPALRVINDHLAAIWDTARPPSDTDLRQTMVVSVPLAEASAKVRTGDPIDDEADVTGPHWAGVVPLITAWGEPCPAADLIEGTPVPEAVAAMAGTGPNPGG
ncbi:MAG TPA: pyridoxamine 5'-phosphate oxidase family protein [Acidimicrobiales bacterium]|nr:pyridoxamine 5'-phosphate oxidase family protein [Acidimicrobiales bacterium]